MANTIEHVAVIGLGYIGLPTAAVLATNGLNVTGVDVKEANVQAINRGEVPFVEPDLNIHVAGAVSHGNLWATTETPEADAYILAVPTPFNADKTADLSYIEAAARAIAPKLRGGELIILESTSPPGATAHLANYLIALRPDFMLDGDDGTAVIHVAHCPERVLPGRVMIELVTNDRIVGGMTPVAAQMASALYKTFCQGKIHLTDAKTAEMAKLVENSYRDVNIAFANELSVISDKVGIDVWELIELANFHPRVNILQPGPGVGGHCIAVDPWFIVSAAPNEANIIRQARQVNDAKPEWVIGKIKNHLEHAPNNSLAVLGLAFKANIDDLRESPAVAITVRLAKELPNTRILVAEPHIQALPKPLTDLDNVSLVASEKALSESEVVALLVDHDDFKNLDRSLLTGKDIVDTRGIWRVSTEQLQGAGSQ